MVPSSRCCMSAPLVAGLAVQRFVRLHETTTRARQRGPDRANGQLERCRNLVIVQPFLSHEQRLAVALRQCLECTPGNRRLLRALERRRLRLDDFLGLCLLAQQLEVTPTARILSTLITHEIRRHGKEPRSLTRQLVLSQRSDERLLRHLLRPITIAEATREIADERVVIRAEETFEIRVAHPILLCHPARAQRVSESCVQSW